MYNKISDKDLIDLLKKNDIKAFTELYERYHSLLFIYCNKKLDNKEDALDIIQDILINIWNKRHVINIQESVKSYLYTAVRNRILDQISHNKVAEKYLQSLEDLQLSNNQPDYLIREKELSTLIRQEIDNMPPRMKEIFLLSRYEWLSNKEISQNLEISQLTVETQIKRALKLLRLRLGNIGSFLFSVFFLFKF